MKKITFKILCHPLIGRLIYIISFGRIINLRWKGFRFYVPSLYTNPTIQASIFWGFYESAEIRLIHKYLRKDLPVVELGGSLGIVSSHIVSRLNRDANITVIEANPNLIATIEKNVKRHNINNTKVKILNKAIGYAENFIHISITNNNTASHITEDKNSGVKVECIKLSDVVSDCCPDRYSLVCDIEGSEIEMVENELPVLLECRQIFIELHKTNYRGKWYCIENMLSKLIEADFRLVEKDGNVFYLENNRYGRK